MPAISRRPVLLGLSLAVVPGRLCAASAVARVTAVTGKAEARVPGEGRVALSPGMDLPAGTSVILFGNATAGFALDDGTLVNAGEFSQLHLGPATVTRGSLNISGVAVVDRRGATAGTSIVVSNPGFEVELANARVFLASLGGGRVFVKDGTAKVRTPAETINLSAGEGVDDIPPWDVVAPAAVPPPAAEPMPAPPPPPPPEVTRWTDEAVADAFASVGLTV